MSGGSKKQDAKPTNTTMPMDTVQPAMPGQLDALSQQLASGYGQAPTDVMAQLMQYYAPMSLPDYSPQTPATPTTPTIPAPAPMTPRGGIIGGKGSRPEYDPKTSAYNPLRSGGANR